MFCKHHYQYTQGHFVCAKCGNRRYSSRVGRRGNKKKIAIPIIIVSIALLVIVVYFGDISIPRQISESPIQDIPKIADDVREKIPEIEEKLGQIRENVDSISKSIPKEIPQVPIVTKPKINPDELESKIHDLVNLERQNNGLVSLVWDQTISDIARAHSQDMASRSYFAHDSPEGIGPDVRGKQYGYDQCGDRDTIQLSKDYDVLSRQFQASGSTDQAMYGRLQQMYSKLNFAISSGMIFGGLSENIAQDNLYDRVWYTNGVPTSYEWNNMDDIASSVVNGWMNSPGHRQNILTPYYYSEGIGVAISPDDKVYVTQNFC